MFWESTFTVVQKEDKLPELKSAVFKNKKKNLRFEIVRVCVCVCERERERERERLQKKRKIGDKDKM